MNLIIESAKGQNSVEIYPDDDCLDPRRSMNNLARFVCWDLGRDYENLGDFNPKMRPEQWLKTQNPDDRIILPIYYRVHRNIELSFEFLEGWMWEVGQIGYAVVTQKRAKQLGVEWDEAKIKERMRKELKAYQNYLNGDVFIVHYDDHYVCGFYSDEEVSSYLKDQFGEYSIVSMIE